MVSFIASVILIFLFVDSLRTIHRIRSSKYKERLALNEAQKAARGKGFRDEQHND
jgi:hypothetical protein